MPTSAPKVQVLYAYSILAKIYSPSLYMRFVLASLPIASGTTASSSNGRRNCCREQRYPI